MLARRLFLLLLNVAVAWFFPGCGCLKPDHIAVGIEHDESEADSSRGLRTVTSTNKFEAHAVYDLPK